MNAIVTTTINPPTEALKRFTKWCEENDWVLYVVGDKKTPHEEWLGFELQHEDNVRYIAPEGQELISQELSDLIGWNCIQRRNFGFIAALRNGAEIIATVDDDNIPSDRWGKNIYVGKTINVREYQTDKLVFDPLSPLMLGKNIWHRGFPLQLLEGRRTTDFLRKDVQVLVQADFWNGDPDIDAICRIAIAPNIRFDLRLSPFKGNKISPFNSQNTFLSAKLFPTYFLFPGIGRMDDIWASYVTQAKFPNSVIYNEATVRQERNPHDLVKDMEAEMIGYKNNLHLAQRLTNGDEWQSLLPERAIKAYEVYQDLLK